LGIDYYTSKVLHEIRQNFKDKKSILLLGNQNLCVPPQYLNDFFDEKYNIKTIRNKFYQNTFAKPFLEELGFDQVHSLEFEEKDNADLILNLNTKIKDLNKKYDIVLNGGTLEHVFNIPVALENIFLLLKKSGFFVSISPTNNLCNHGFYQFSPDLFISLDYFNENLDLKKLYIIENHHELQKKSKIYECNYQNIDKSNTLNAYKSSNPTEILTIIQKKEEFILNENLIQLAYINNKKNNTTTSNNKKVKKIPELFKYIFQVHLKSTIFFFINLFKKNNFKNDYYIKRKTVSLIKDH
tara:strand:+ start:452 stop:1342 length:891 start_codon:yes stop_codon:yes gene_type:complete